ncbi:hypothetical protein FB565_003225 [Actinoplanes lutulentus]|uniref:Uncharacterized protein n=1 Tax=Actinoplanes lutulentus TaxID=1287878 RepID=A0A327YXP8_9ACTN|nr:hypothetical protein [Actinoplanes lutulentus]MBB2943512.1 hypothetical protein [Actinoplanes lutulentus]RAK25969.1 hypothetical protein B0I29_1293 [Actinoplanes lutulentus]
MGIYLVNIRASDWAQDERALLLNEALAARGLPPYPGPKAMATAENFEEKLVPRMNDFWDLCARYSNTEALGAMLIVPADFTGLIELPVKSNLADVTSVASAWRMREAIAPMAAEVKLPLDLPSGPMALTEAFTDRLIFYVALFKQAAEYSLRHNCPLEYV